MTLLPPRTGEVCRREHSEVSTPQEHTAIGPGDLVDWSYYKAGQINWTASMLLALGLFIGAWFGAQLGQHLDAAMLKKGFAVLLVFMAVKLWMG